MRSARTGARPGAQASIAHRIDARVSGELRPSGEPPYWAPGTTILWRYRRAVETASPMIVVEDGPEQLVAWLPRDTPVLTTVLPDGRDVRSLGPVEMFRHGRALRRTVWRGHGSLRIAPTGQPWSMWVFWHDDGSHRCWYVNLEEPHRRDPVGVVSRDRVVDLVVEPDRTVRWKDLDELDGAVAAGRFTAAEAQGYLADGAAVQELVSHWAAPFRDGWERWRPDPGWPRPQLPGHLTADY